MINTLRNIKFRGWNPSTKKWIYGMPTYDFIYVFDSEQLDSYDNYEVDPYSVSEYTGLKDKNDVEIYEGDIIKMTIIEDDSGWATDLYGVEPHCNWWVDLTYHSEVICEVIYIDGSYKLKHGRKSYPLDLDVCRDAILNEKYDNINGEKPNADEFYRIKIIGNIYENPELLEEK